MKSTRKLLPALLAAGAVLAGAAGISAATAADEAPSATPSTAGEHGWHHHRGPWHLLAKLGLSAAQKQQIKDIMTAAHPQMQSLREQMHAQQAEVRAQVFKVLTPAQQEQLATLEAGAR
jgi:Spy/CpxP family protein refolding chaperone